MGAVKVIGSSGQISLGKQYAGRHVLVDEVEPGVWMLKLGEFVPDSERWLHEPTTAESVARAVAWAEANPPSATDLDELDRRLAAADKR
jgi:hypothetical protein